jgi:hypothetical protein
MTAERKRQFSFDKMHSSFAIPRRILAAVAAFASLGAAFAAWLSTRFAAKLDPRNAYNAFCVLFSRDEGLGLGLVAVFSCGAAFYFFRERKIVAAEGGMVARKLSTATLVALIATAVFAIGVLGTEFVCHNYGLSADEFMADFQAQIFLRGKITAEVPAQWLPIVRAIKPTYVDYFPATHSWKSAYLPVYAAMRAVFQGIHLQSFLNPFLAALTVLALYGTARNIWPNAKSSALVACLLLGASPQFLVMAMTGYSMPAHLALNTIWLWLYSRPDRRRFYLAPVVGVFAIGLHQPTVHALFAAPFLIRLVVQRRWRAVWIFALIYSLGCGVWYAWRSHYPPTQSIPLHVLFRLFNPKMLLVQPMDLLLLVGWSALATPLLVALGLRHIFSERPILQDAALSCLLTFCFYYFFLFDQGHGWGYRYFHGAVSCFVLIAVVGWQWLLEKIGLRTATNFVAAGIALSLLVQLPLRCVQAETFVRPFARASDAIHAIDAELVGLDPTDAWYSADLIRTDPFLENRPIVVALADLRQSEIDPLSSAGKARFITRAALEQLGLGTKQEPIYRATPFRLGLGP